MPADPVDDPQNPKAVRESSVFAAREDKIRQSQLFNIPQALNVGGVEEFFFDLGKMDKAVKRFV